MRAKHSLLPLIVLSSLLLFGTAGAGEAELSAEAATNWLDGYKSAWETRDADKAAALFTEDATYQDNPYNTPYKGRESIHQYWAGVTADQRGVAFNYDLLTTYGQTAVARWTATFNSASSGAEISLDGVFLLEFDENGLCRSLKEWWHLQVNEKAGE